METKDLGEVGREYLGAGGREGVKRSEAGRRGSEESGGRTGSRRGQRGGGSE
jgi:hypothetical protein